MINELSELAEAIQSANIETIAWHPDYLTLPKIKSSKPCVRILLRDGKVFRLSSLSSEQGKVLRKFGNNQASYPAMNINPLFRITDKSKVDIISKWLDAKDDSIEFDGIEDVRSWCTENNWEKFKDKYRRCVINCASELQKKTNGTYEPLNILIADTERFHDPEELHSQLREIALDMIDNGEDIRLALQILFFLEKKEKEDDSGSISVIFDSLELEKQRTPTISSGFTKGLNSALLSEKAETEYLQDNAKTDAFGLSFCESGKALPEISLPAGFDVILRTMFDGQPCQYRYGKIKNDSYPLSEIKVMQFKTALEWLSQECNENKTWSKTGKNEVFFAYPSKLLTIENGLDTVQTFAGNKDSKEADFVAITENFIGFITEAKKLDPDNYPDNIHLFALNKYDKARTRIAYSRCTTPDYIIEKSELWNKAANNLPPLWRLQPPQALFPLDIASVMNRTWRRDGTQISNKYRHTGKYHGVDLFFGVHKTILLEDLRELVHNSENMAAYVSTALRNTNQEGKKLIEFKKCLKETSTLMGMYLYWIGIRKEDYMNEYPYLLGQILKISDAVHELYCNNVRKGNPTQFVGSAMYLSATEMPLKTFALLGVRMQPYLSWCKVNQTACTEWTSNNGEKHHGPNAGYYLHQYELLADKLKGAFTQQTRFSDAEKAQLFIGYLASFETAKNGSDSD